MNKTILFFLILTAGTLAFLVVGSIKGYADDSVIEKKIRNEISQKILIMRINIENEFTKTSNRDNQFYLIGKIDACEQILKEIAPWYQ